MKKLLILVFAVFSAWVAYEQAPSAVGPAAISGTSNAELERAISERRTGFQVSGSGTIARILADDNYGSRHQRFIVSLETGQTLLIAHNIDVAERVDGIRPGDSVVFFGEYEWNERGGVIHWTHHDPGRRHVDGWIEFRGKRYD